MFSPPTRSPRTLSVGWKNFTENPNGFKDGTTEKYPTTCVQHVVIGNTVGNFASSLLQTAYSIKRGKF